MGRNVYAYYMYVYITQHVYIVYIYIYVFYINYLPRAYPPELLFNFVWFKPSLHGRFWTDKMYANV